MKQAKNYILTVDSHRRAGRMHNTAGRYLVSAKDEKGAVKALRDVIGFGSIHVLGQAEDVMPSKRYGNMPCGQARKMLPGGVLKEPVHATAKR